MTEGLIRVAVPELRRMAPDVLRVLGLPLGQADETAEMVAWTEAARGGALQFVRENRANLLWKPRPRPTVASRKPHESTLDARGSSLLECGVRVADFVCAEAAASGEARVIVRRTYGSVFVPYLVVRCRHHGYVLTADSVGPEDVTAHESASTIERRFDLELQAERVSMVGHAPSEDARLAERYRQSIIEGILVERDDYSSFEQLFEMLRVPTSERSRTHAG